jgi:tight adherence protein B
MDLATDFGTPGVALGLLLVTIVVGLLALRVFLRDRAERAAMAERSALELAEKRAARLRYRLDRRLLRTPVGRALGVRIGSAGAGLMSIDFLALCVGAFIGGTALLNIAVPLWLALIGGAVCVRLCFVWVEKQREKRRLAFVTQLPEVARLLSNASSAGLAIRAAIDMAAEELDAPASDELRLVSEELALGQSVGRALQNLEQRMPSRDVGVLISTLVIQQRAGGDLVNALQDMADTLDQRRDLTREIRTVMAGSVATGYMVAGLGAVTVFLMNAITPGVLDDLTSSVPGLIAVGFAGGLYVLGFLLIRKVTRVEV